MSKYRRKPEAKRLPGRPSMSLTCRVATMVRPECKAKLMAAIKKLSSFGHEVSESELVRGMIERADIVREYLGDV